MDDARPPSAGKPCAICGKPADPRFRPFCSSRCRLIDLGRWLDGDYRIPATENPDEEEDSPPSDTGEG